MQQVRKCLAAHMIDRTAMAPPDFIALTRDLCAFATGVVADDNEALFARIADELPLALFRYRSGDSFNGWLVPQNWRGSKAEIRRDGPPGFDGRPPPPRGAPHATPFSRSLRLVGLNPPAVPNHRPP